MQIEQVIVYLHIFDVFPCVGVRFVRASVGFMVIENLFFFFLKAYAV